MTDEGSKPEILSRIAQTTVALTRLKPVWNDRNISLSSQIRPMRSLVISIFAAKLQRRIQAMETRCYRKILCISYKDHVTNEEVRAKTQQAIGPHKDLLTIVRRHKLQWYGDVSRSLGLAKTILQGTVKGKKTRQGRWSAKIQTKYVANSKPRHPVPSFQEAQNLNTVVSPSPHRKRERERGGERCSNVSSGNKTLLKKMSSYQQNS